jgi:hypothetical protein
LIVLIAEISLGFQSSAKFVIAKFVLLAVES